MSGDPTSMRDAVVRKAQESARVKEQFFEAHADTIVRCARSMVEAFERGGTLYAMGNGGSACDAQHVAVEMQHPIFETRRALPAVALPLDAPLLTAVGNDEDQALVFSRQLGLLARPEDIALGISTSGKSANVVRGLKKAREIGMLTIGFAGRDGGSTPDVCDYCFTVESFSIHRIQETHETLVHVLWDALHVVAGEEDVL